MMLVVLFVKISFYFIMIEKEAEDVFIAREKSARGEVKTENQVCN